MFAQKAEFPITASVVAFADHHDFAIRLEVSRVAVVDARPIAVVVPNPLLVPLSLNPSKQKSSLHVPTR